MVPETPRSLDGTTATAGEETPPEGGAVALVVAGVARADNPFFTEYWNASSSNWTVQADKSIKFTFDAATTSLVNLTSFALHWGETCQNDVIEGVVSIVPTPASLPLIALGLGMIVALRRRTPALKQH